MAPGISPVVRHAHRVLLEHPATAVALATLFFVVTAWFGVELRYLHDEGIFTYDAARALPDAFLATFFFLKLKPLLALLYAAPSQLGLSAFLVVHAALGSAAIALVCAAARRLGLPAPNLAGWTLACSLGYEVATGAGFANSDGAFGLALFLYLYLGDSAAKRAGERLDWRRSSAALLVGALPFVRNELAAPALLFVGWDVWHRRDVRFVVGAMAFPLSYSLAGAAYHRDLLWLVSHFPNPEGKPAGIASHDIPTAAETARYLLRSLALNFGLLGLLAPFGWRRGDRRIAALFVAGVGTLLLMTAFQSVGRFGFDTSLRYHVALLPAFALLAASAAGSPSRLPWLGAAGLALLLFIFSEARPPPLLLLVPVAVAAWRLRAKASEAPRLLLLAGAVTAFVSAVVTSDYGEEQHRRSHQLLDAVKATGVYHGQPLYTDLHIVRFDRCANVDAYMLANESIRWEIDRFLNPHNGQRADVVRALLGTRFLVDVEAHDVRRDAIYLLRDGDRTLGWRTAIEAFAPRRERIAGYWLYHWPDTP